MNTIKHLLLPLLFVPLSIGCSKSVNMGSPVGTWNAHQITVTFNADGTVVRRNEGGTPDPDFLLPLEDGKAGTWKTENHNLFLTAKSPDGSSNTQRYKYSVGTGSEGEPAMNIEILEGPHKSGYVFIKQ